MSYVYLEKTCCAICLLSRLHSSKAIQPETGLKGRSPAWTSTAYAIYVAKALTKTDYISQEDDTRDIGVRAGIRIWLRRRCNSRVSLIFRINRWQRAPSGRADPLKIATSRKSGRERRSNARRTDGVSEGVKETADNWSKDGKSMTREIAPHPSIRPIETEIGLNALRCSV